MRKSIVFYALVVFLSCACAQATLSFKMTSADTQLFGGEQTVIDIHVMDTVAGAGNGLVTWQFDLTLDNDALVQVVDWSIIEPSPYEAGVSPTLNSPMSGDITGFSATAADLNAASEIGVGGYTKIATVTIQALENVQGAVTYALGNDSGLGFFGVNWDSTYQDGSFDENQSNTMFTVVPEPSSLLILSGLGIMGYLRRKK